MIVFLILGALDTGAEWQETLSSTGHLSERDLNQVPMTAGGVRLGIGQGQIQYLEVDKKRRGAM
jgi:hypothetical protein